ncbi:MAG: hypothetical protein WCO66_04985 [Candidatus Absconditabacteria bacterium]
MKQFLSSFKYVVIGGLFLLIGYGSHTFAVAPNFDNNFAQFMTNKTPDQNGRVESVFDFSKCIKRDNSIEQNIKNLFYPSTTPGDSECSVLKGGILWDAVKIITFGLLFVFIVIAGMGFLLNGAENSKKAAMNMVYLAYGAFLVYGSIWILGYVLNVENVAGSADLVNNLQNNLFLQILGFFKVMAFFIAIVMMVWTGYKMMSAMDKEDKIKEGRKGVINIIVALVLIKIVDYVFYIAQSVSFAAKASALVLDLAKILGWVLGIVFVLGLMFAGYSMFVSNGDEKAMKKTRSILINIFMISLVLFFFLLIVYQIFNEFVV